MIRYKLSKYLQVIPAKNDKFFVFSSRYGGLVKMNKPLFNYFVSLDKKELDLSEELPKKFFDRKFIVEEDVDEDKYFQDVLNKTIADSKSGKLWDFLRLNLSENCNLRCKYCYMCNKKNVNFNIMPFETAEKAIKAFYQNLKLFDIKDSSLWFFGGEPMLNLSLLEKCLKLIEKMNEGLENPPRLIIVTNGTIYPERLISLFKKLNMSINFSMDGIGKAHDSMRCFADGRGSFQVVEENLRRYKKDGFRINLGAVLNINNIDHIKEMIDYCNKIGQDYFSIGVVAFDLTYRADVDKMVSVLLELLDYAKEKKVSLGGFWKGVLSQLNKPNGLKHCAGTGNEITVQPDGTLRPCSAFEDSFGHIDDLESYFSSPGYELLVSRMVGNLGHCNGCPIEGMCKGGCVAEVYNQDKSLETKPSYCELFQKITTAFITKMFDEEIMT